MPVRKIPRSGRSITGRVARYGGVGSVAHESNLEHDCIFLFHFDLKVAYVEEQPAKITYKVSDPAGRRRTQLYFPDFLVKYHGWTKRPPVLVEVKFRDELKKNRDEVLPEIKAGRGYARQRGWRFRVYTEKYIRGPLLTNIRFLLPYRRFPRDEARCRRLLAALTALGRARVSQLLDNCSQHGTEERGKYVACLWWLVSVQEITVDLTTPLSMSAELWPEKQPLRP